MRFLKFLLVGATILLFGCAHPISIAPKEGGIERTADMPDRIKSKVGLYIASESIQLEVTTPGGGGDNVRYFPYRDLEASYEKMLKNVFDVVIRVSNQNEKVEFERSGLTHIISPELVTSSGSTGFFTWPPTNFTVDLTTKIKDAAGVTVASPRVIGVASVGGIGEMKGNFGLTGQLAMQDAMKKAQIAIFEYFSNADSNGASSKKPTPNRSGVNLSSTERLTELKYLFDKNLIGAEDYEKKKKEILGDL